MSSSEGDLQMDPVAGTDRRGFLERLSSWFMAGGLAAGYGACGAVGARYLYPLEKRDPLRLFVARADDLAVGDSVTYHTPAGARVAIARQGSTNTVDDFVALSSTCPHLGCQVHWEPQNDRFFCPCHNGAFDPGGAPIAGPPKEAGQSLPRYALTLEDGLLFIEVPAETLARADDEPRPGHDPCLGPRPLEPSRGEDEQLA